MRHFKSFTQLFESSFSDELEASEVLDLIAMGADRGTVTEVWIQEFDQYYNSALQGMLTHKQKEKLRKEYLSGEFSWTFRNYEGEYDGNEDLLASMKKEDKKDLDKLKSQGWEIWYTDVDGETPQDAWFYFLLSRPEDPRRLSSEAKSYIKQNKLSSESVIALGKLLNPADGQEMRGTVHGSKFGL